MFCKCILTPSLSFETIYLMYAVKVAVSIISFKVFTSRQRMNVM